MIFNCVVTDKLTITQHNVALPGVPVTFSASCGDVPNLTYYWEFEGPQIIEGQTVTHVYQKSGTQLFSMSAEKAATFVMKLDQQVQVRYMLYLPLIY